MICLGTLFKRKLQLLNNHFGIFNNYCQVKVIGNIKLSSLALISNKTFCRIFKHCVYTFNRDKQVLGSSRRRLATFTWPLRQAWKRGVDPIWKARRSIKVNPHVLERKYFALFVGIEPGCQKCIDTCFMVHSCRHHQGSYAIVSGQKIRKTWGRSRQTLQKHGQHARVSASCGQKDGWSAVL